MTARPKHTCEVIVRHTNLVQERGGFIPAQFHDEVDEAESALD